MAGAGGLHLLVRAAQEDALGSAPFSSSRGGVGGLVAIPSSLLTAALVLSMTGATLNTMIVAGSGIGDPRLPLGDSANMAHEPDNSLTTGVS